ncbi:hypothetical protein [Streptomyces sp. CA-253872]|uniref:hypothetical protein n=1 Tax=Streptomyces sp. CA-253872 TaxID=3240067 RepID=UPI003D8F4DFE
MNAAVLADLRAALADLHTYEARLTVHDTTPELLREVGQGLTLARRLLAAAAAVPVTGCRRHPEGPVDSEAGGCLLCNTRRRSALTPADREAATPADVLAAIEEHGPEAAARRYGARLVARALATAGRHTTSNLPPEHRPGPTKGQPA